MSKFLNDLLDAVNDRIEGVLRRAFEAGQSYERGSGPNFETWLAEQKRKIN